ncbi:ATP-binding cassette sub-family G member 5 isoform X1 [Vespa velutina]|uniref:ATP-binding cassette sub-family G member 5 isoform X1 n=1 Tax=Vespa velutina TaxID=202808 RepID=UPI001FB3E551|nr:ATP-binding cassette sub-family G member 5 isoform X1 [Vespa velutina]XP_047343549.1 ATP-binding cassette sub-family G member 5 isoform X1 [Vespa velutina]XP_047343550.1 ATP-binding cassette sub-family G member 5 isoform X1 [Vespa velutina]XP_047343551.1 ATP-binding cassette sub-family G member 5 isoform X1 [Vespa velutina]XP_047343553.1 ATP-binding cassette sub-family G member 5 isoform X1 [Vespa velutina]XP_047343554.1 ATP-binding cassette sub-family G member 5 isoform X1 [Vespa velutina]
MTPSDCILDISNVFHSTTVIIEKSCLSKSEPTSVLRDVSARVHGGEVLAILGSKGSGKRALLDVIAGRAEGEVRGRITLNGNLLTPELFRRHGGYVAHRCHLLPSLTVRQTLTYAMWLANLNNREARVRQALADLALSQVANRCVNDLTRPEYRRLMLGVQLAKDPMLLLLDEPTWDTDPLNTYLIVSMLWSYATRRGSIVVLTMETPRSDVLPFVSRVTLLCLGAVVYSGPTRSMLDYFTYIGFPCPELENPLMYYLCLSTVDRRSRDRFLESDQQISVLVEKFKVEGLLYMKEAPQISPNLKDTPLGIMHKGLGRGIKPGCFSTLLALYLRSMAATFSFNKCGLGHFSARFLLLPFSVALMSILYSHSTPVQSRIFLQTGGLVFNVLMLFYVTGIATTSLLFPGFRARYYQEKREGLYGGAMFLTAYTLLSLPLSFISTLITISILIPILELDLSAWAHTSGILWSSYIAAEQITVALLMILENSLTGAITVLYVALLSLGIGSGAIRSLRNLPHWLATISSALPARYASLALNQLAMDMPIFSNLPYNETVTCPGIPELCRYADGRTYLIERFTREGENISEVLNVELNLLICLAFAVGLIILNSILYLLPLPARVKAKFRE